MKGAFKKTMLMGTDILIVGVSIFLSYFIHYGGAIPAEYVSQWTIYTITSIVACTSLLLGFKLYNRLWRYASVGELISIAKAVFFGCLVSYAVASLLSGKLVHPSILILIFETLLLLLGGT